MDVEVAPTGNVILALSLDEMAVLVGAFSVANQILNESGDTSEDSRHMLLSEMNDELQERFCS